MDLKEAVTVKGEQQQEVRRFKRGSDGKNLK